MDMQTSLEYLVTLEITNIAIGMRMSASPDDEAPEDMRPLEDFFPEAVERMKKRKDLVIRLLTA